MNQLPLFEPRRFARRTDPVTSHEAAESAGEIRNRHANAILKLLRDTGQELSAEQIADAIDMDGLDMVAVCRRLSELIEAGKIERTDKKATNRSGRSAFCHRAVR